MRRAIAPLILLLLWGVTGCEKDSPDLFPDSELELTDGFCLVSDNRVVLNHHDIGYYDNSAHLIYLESPLDFGEELTVPGKAWVYADRDKIYELSLVPHVSSYIPPGPIIWFPDIFYADYIVHIDQWWYDEDNEGGSTDPREDPRIVEALERYGQFRHGLQGEISSVSYTSPGHVELEMELRNEDAVNYYYFDPEKMGMDLFHYFTNGLYLWDTATTDSYTNHTGHIQPDPWDSLDLDWMSLLEADCSVTLTLVYESFDEIPPGSYMARFSFPGIHTRMEYGELDQEDGRLWLGKIQMSCSVTFE